MTAVDVPFEKIVALLPQGVAVHVGGRLSYVNEAFVRLLGHATPEEVVGRSWRDFIHPDELAVAETNVQSALTAGAGATFHPVERRLVAKDGSPVTVELVAVSLSVGESRGLMIVAHDLTERKRLEQKLRDADHYAAVGKVAASIAHELNNPLACVLGNLAFSRNVLAERRGNAAPAPSDDSALLDAIAEAHQGTERIRQVVSDLGVLPRAPDGYTPRMSVAPAGAKARRYRVLVIDDDPLVLRSLRRLLRKHDATAVESGEEALKVLSSQEFDVVFCDLMMPGMTGMDVYDRLVEQGRGIERKLVFLSGGAFTDRARQMLEKAPNLRFEKPLDPEQLESILAAATGS